jgi:hypothetical protein
MSYRAIPSSGRGGWVVRVGGRELVIDDATCELVKEPVGPSTAP